MTEYDLLYEQYGKSFPLTAEDEATLRQAREELERLKGDPGMTPREDGFVSREGVFTLDPETRQYISIATRLADRQLRELPAMPEDREAAARFPEVDPVGSFSIIDLKFAQRIEAVQAALQSRAPEVSRYGWGLVQDLAQPDGKVQTAMRRAAEEHRTMTRGSKLCHSAAGRRIMHQRAKELETCAAVVDYDKMLQGAEYAAGLRTGPVPGEVRDFYQNVLGKRLDAELIVRAELASPPADGLYVKFEDLDNKLLHQAQANPRNWGKTERELREYADAIEEDKVLEAISPYARAAADRVGDPAFAYQERASGGAISRADLIIIDGKTVREKMFEDYNASHRDVGGFDAFFRENVRQATDEYVAAGLMAGKRVEAFVPDGRGRIPAQPSQILPAADGYSPSPLKPERFNAWQRFFSRHGFYREKVERQAEYDRMMAARERVRLTNAAHQWELAGGTLEERKELFFGAHLRENGGKLGFNSPFGPDGSALENLAVSTMLFRGYSLEEIFDPNAHRQEKEETGREVCQWLKKGDMKRVGEVLVNGLVHLRDELDRRTAGLDMADEGQMLSGDQRFTALASRLAVSIGRQAGQECCKRECLAAMDRYLQDRNWNWQGKDYLDMLRGGVGAVAAYFNTAQKAMAGRAELAGGLAVYGRARDRILDQMGYEVAKAGFGDPRDGSPKEKTCERFTRTSPLHTPFSSFGFEEKYRDFMAAAGEPQTCKAVGEGFMQGRLQERISVKEVGAYDYAVEVAPPTEKGDLELRSAEELKAAKHVSQKQAVKQSKPPQLSGPR